MKLGIFFISLLFLNINNISAQNYFTNSGFEDYNICAEFKQQCAIEAWFYTPVYQYPTHGQNVPNAIFDKNFLIIPMADSINNKRVFVYTMLCCPLKKGSKYNLSFYLNTMELQFTHLDFYFSDKEPNLSSINLRNVTPTFSLTEGNATDEIKLGWRLVEKEFVANGDEKFCTIGNFAEPQSTNKIRNTNCYFIDEIKLTPEDNIKLCDNYFANRSKLYNQNYRHTNAVLILKDTFETIIKSQKIDTLILPNVLFETNNFNLRPEFQKILDTLIFKLKNNPPNKIEIFGYTDNVGNSLENIDLSLKRADEVKDYILKNYPILQNKIYSYGKGSQFPIATNLNAKGRLKNRRVELIISF